jgi:DNA-binding phage protein
MAGFTYKSYSFVDKDPIIDYARTVVQRSNMDYNAVHLASGVGKSTIRKMFDGATQRPQAATVNAILRACGFKLSVRSITETDPVTPTGAVISMRHVTQIAKYRAVAQVKKAKARKTKRPRP